MPLSIPGSSIEAATLIYIVIYSQNIMTLIMHRAHDSRITDTVSLSSSPSQRIFFFRNI